MNRPTARQTALDLRIAPTLTFDTFVEGDSNRAALTYVRAFPDWPSPVALLIGPEGAGKTHLGTAFQVAHPDALFLDEAQRLDEETLFARFNDALAGDLPGLLLAALLPWDGWGIGMPDLESRLRNTPVFALDEPGEDILENVLRRLFAAKGREVKADVITYVLSRMSRSVSDLKEIVDILESEARSVKADMTRAFVSGVLNRQPELFD